jgi:hypothetical protein
MEENVKGAETVFGKKGNWMEKKLKRIQRSKRGNKKSTRLSCFCKDLYSEALENI